MVGVMAGGLPGARPELLSELLKAALRPPFHDGGTTAALRVARAHRDAVSGWGWRRRQCPRKIMTIVLILLVSRPLLTDPKLLLFFNKKTKSGLTHTARRRHPGLAQQLPWRIVAERFGHGQWPGRRRQGYHHHPVRDALEHVVRRVREDGGAWGAVQRREDQRR